MGSRAITRLEGASFFCPRDVAVLQAAVDQSWRIVSSRGVADDGVREVLAKGVVQATRGGERELDALTVAGCRNWEQGYV
jgi:hypothetical protein